MKVKEGLEHCEILRFITYDRGRWKSDIGITDHLFQ